MAIRFWSILLLSLFCYVGYALDSDYDQPATLDADDMEMDFSTGVRTYRGNVVFRQGSIRLVCDELTTYLNENDALDKAVCIGNPGIFNQRPEGQTTDVIGSAMRITMDQVNELVTLKTYAKVVQGNSTITGKLITYNLATEKASVKGGGVQSAQTTATANSESSSSSTAASGTQSTRPSIVIQPRKKKTTEQPSSEQSSSDG